MRPTMVGATVTVPRATAHRHDRLRSAATDARGDEVEKKKKEYTEDMPAKIYAYFRGFSESGVPSMSKFAMVCGITLAELQSWRTNAEFDRACIECAEIRRDMLIDAALTKRHDSSFTKFLLSAEFGMGETAQHGDGQLEVSIEVVGE